MREQEKLTTVGQFEKKTYKEVKIWDWLGRALPLTVLAALCICYFFKWNTALELILEISIFVFFVISFVWWYWAIYKIAVTVKYMRETQEKFISLRQELKRFKQSFNNPKIDKTEK